METIPWQVLLVIIVVGLVACVMVITGDSLDKRLRDDPWPNEEWDTRGKNGFGKGGWE
jgi:hypothetical protein